ncbi:MAG: DUF6174 domain-containing protein [Ignavibacteriaceae bacterium]
MKSFYFFSVLTFIIIINGCDNILESDLYDYTIEQQMGCYCPQGGIWVKLFISADTVSNAIRTSDNNKLTYDEFKHYKSIKGLFNKISETDTSTYDLIVTYESTNNYPSFIYINPKPIVINDSTVVTIEDAQLSYTTKNYKNFNY